MIIPVSLGKNSYDIVIKRGVLGEAGEYLDLKRKVLIVTDDGVPSEYSQSIANLCDTPIIKCVAQGEGSKSFPIFEELLKIMLENNFTRRDCVVAVGGGVVGDLSGFAAASYMRGIDFYNIPTTVLSEVDSSVGGKTAINLCGIKNIVGAFYQPKKVLIDADTLSTLDKRQVSNGLAEAVKMALTFDEELFRLFEEGNISENIELIIKKSLEIKKSVVERDERESGLRKVLNFGHTIGHAIESFEGLGGLLHGECVALGMIPMCSDGVRERLIKVLQKLDLPTECRLDKNKIYKALLHDKKSNGRSITAITVEKAGSYKMTEVSADELISRLGAISK